VFTCVTALNILIIRMSCYRKRLTPKVVVCKYVYSKLPIVDKYSFNQCYY